MENTLYFLRHGKTKVDSSVPISRWILSEKGEAQTRELVDSGVFSSVEIIICSGEEKAYQTAKPIADALGKEIVCYDDLSELNRDAGGFLSAEEYERTVESGLQHRDRSLHNWETAASALARFSKKIDELKKDYSGKNILIVGHGITMNMYFSQLLGKLDEAYSRMKTNTFCDWGVVKGTSVIKDLAN